MGNIFDIFFPKTGNVIAEGIYASDDITDFIKSHTVEIPGESRMVMIPVEEFEEMVRMSETIIEKEEVPESVPKIETEQAPQPNPQTSFGAQQDASSLPEDPKSDTTNNTELLSKLNELKEMLQQESHKDGIIKDLHKELEKLNGNFFEDIRRPMIKSIIAIHRQMTGRVKAIEKTPVGQDADYEKLYQEMVKNLKFDMTAIGDTLEDEYDLEFFEPVAGDLYNPKEDNAIRVVSTDDEYQDGVIQKVLYGGFKNTNTDKIFLKANVIVYKFKK